jgi:predicted RNA-binding protein associated with RNAse of E/G family
MSELKKIILNTIEELCSDFLYYDRKEDETLGIEELDNAVKDGTITIDEMVEAFRKHLEDTFKN